MARRIHNMIAAWVFVTFMSVTSNASGDRPKNTDRSVKDSPHGKDALLHLPDGGPTMKRLSKKLNKTQHEVKSMFSSDPTLHLDLNGLDDETRDPAIFYMEETQILPSSPNADLPRRRAVADVFKLHSRPGASKVLYLDFDGHVLTGTAWNDATHPTINAPPCDWDGAPNSFSTTEQSYIQEIWARVAEDYAPFDIDVTTEYVAGNEDFLLRSSSSDLQYGLRVLISPGIGSIWCSCGGLSYVGIYGAVGSYYQPSLVFPDMLSYGVKYIAEAASHEAGHAFGLSHDGTASVGYYTGQGSGETGWAPIMGVGYYQSLVQWSKGEYSGANNLEDDLAIIAARVPYRPDDAPDTPAAAAAQLLPPGPALSAAGVIDHPGDVDVFAFLAAAGPVSASATPAPPSPNLDLLLELLDPAGAVLASANPVDALAAALAFTLPAPGTYFLRVSAVGAGSPFVTGYSAYGSLGQYTLAATVPPPLVAGTTTASPGSPTTTAAPKTTTAAAPKTTTAAAPKTTTAAAPKTTTAAPPSTTTARKGRKRSDSKSSQAYDSATEVAGASGAGGYVAAAAGGIGGASVLLAGLAAALRRRRCGQGQAGREAEAWAEARAEEGAAGLLGGAA